jgi:glycosyltransferase involved in cell wall biosynthesis
MKLDSMRVALFTDADTFAGTERHVLDLATGLRRNGVQVRIACPVPSALATRSDARGMPVVPVQKGGLIDRTAIATLRRLLKSGEINILHAHNGRTALLSVLAARAAGTGACVMTQHFLDPHHTSLRGPRALVARMAHKAVHRRTSRFIAISEAVGRNMLDRGDAPAEKIAVVHNGMVDADRQELRPAGDVRRELGVAKDAPLVACVSRLEPEKDVRSLVSAMALVVRVRPDATCILAGDGAQREALADQARQLGLNGAARFLGFRTDVLSLIAACDVFVLPSTAEPFGLVLLEAMSLGKPVIATAAGGPLEIVEHGRTGLLVPASDPAALANAIEQLLGDPAQRTAMGMAGRRRFENLFTVDRMARDVIGVYGSCGDAR